ncbi:hypothetical protein CRI93_04605 [Longimonas halophila]|uniref:Polymerase nucleotidyl transferase domain-containing protein n=1 Tax=Longimonas halophila TaxID=1469170 RepID=A0A2H3P774_9BACT|nr:nucleotidyltransferase domain-containing protein [Longimonas halophila]PEN08398.1 hypothetical protein CRI93_04605 [Longimonas halophila]
MSNQALLDRVGDVVRAYPSIQAAWVFGSIANDTATPQSDLDCAVLGPAPLAASIMQVLISRWVTDQADWMPLRHRIVQTRLKQWIES